MLEVSLVGATYRVDFRMEVKSCMSYSRGDHGMGGGEYEVRYGSGSVVVHDLKQKQCVAAVALTYSRTEPSGLIREISEEKFQRCIEVSGLLPEREKDYADWLGEAFVKLFRTHQGPELPRAPLQLPSRELLIQGGFVPSEDGQVALTLSA